MKKFICLLTAVILSASFFAGCGSKNSAQNNKVPNNSKAVTSQNTNSNAASNSQQNKSSSAAPALPKTSSGTFGTISAAVNAVNSNIQTRVSANSMAASKNIKKTTKTIKPAAKPITLNNAVKGASAYLELLAKAVGYKISDWDAAALSFYGYNINSPEFKANGKGYIDYRAEAIKSEINNYYMTDYARTILGLESAGYNPSDFNGINLVNTIKNSMLPDGKFKDNVNGGETLLNCHVWSMIALESAGCDYDRDKAVNYIKERQNSDGGFYIFTGYKDSDTDFTAMTVIALTMAGETKNDASVSRALNYLQKQVSIMNKNSCNENAETLSSILEAVVCAKDDINKYKINGKNLVDEIISFRNADGGFKHLKTGSSNDISTRQALTALLFYKNNRNMYKGLKADKVYSSTEAPSAKVIINNAYYDEAGKTAIVKGTIDNIDEAVINISDDKNTYTEDLKDANIDIKKEMPLSDYTLTVICKNKGSIVNVYSYPVENISSVITASVRIEAPDRTIIKKQDFTLGNKIVYDSNGLSYKTGKVSAYAFVMNSLIAQKIPSAVSYTWGAPYISGIDMISGGKFGGWDGWMYYINNSDPSVGMTDAEIKNGDEILVYYGDYGIKPLTIETVDTANSGEMFSAAVKCGDLPVAGAVVKAGNSEFVTDDKGIANIQINDKGKFEVYAEKNDANGKPLYIRSDRKTITVN